MSISRPNPKGHPDNVTSGQSTHPQSHAQLTHRIHEHFPNQPLPSDLTYEQLQCITSELDRSNINRAHKLLLCRPSTTNYEYGVEQRTACGKPKACSYCAERWAIRQSENLLTAAHEYSSPVAVLITAPSQGLFDCGQTLKALKQDLFRLRRRKQFHERCKAGVLAMEVEQTQDKHRWNVHAHGILDVAGDLLEQATWEGWCAAQWQALRGTGALFSCEPIRSARALAQYAVKLGRDKSFLRPLNGARLQTHLAAALHRKRLVVSWGASK